MKYVLCARKSTDEEDKQVLSIEAQLDELREFALKEKLEIVNFRFRLWQKSPRRWAFQLRVIEITMKLLSSLLVVAFTTGVIIPATAFAQPADSPWPMFGGNPRHTGLSQYETGKAKKDLIWTYKAGGGVESSPVIGSDGIIYVGSHDGYLYVLNPNGTLKWKFEVSKPVYDERWKTSKAIMATPAVDKNGTVYINGASNYLHAITTDGKEKWRFFIKWLSDFWNGPIIGNDGTVFIGTARSDGTTEYPAGLYAISPAGKEIWRYPEPSGVTVVPAVGDDETVYFGAAESSTNRGRIVALNPDGKKKWQYDMEQWLEGSASIGADGTIFSGSKEGNVYAVNPDGTEKWRFKTGNGISATPSIGPDSNVYVGSWDGNFYALESKTGKELWRFDVKVGRDPKLFEGYPGKEAICSSAAISKDGVIYFADVFDTVYALDLSGKELWRYKHWSGFVTTAAIGQDGAVYFGSGYGEVLAFGGQKISKVANDTTNDKRPKENNFISIVTIVGSLAVLAVIISVVIFVWRKKQKEKY